MEQKRVQKQPSVPVKTEGEVVSPKKNEKIERDKVLTDDLLDEIDGILEENAEAFVVNYVQAGGQ